VQQSYIWGNYIDELLLMEDVAGDGGTAGADYFALRHHNYNVVALTDSSGSVQERYDYNPYGQRFVLDADFSDDSDGQSDFGLKIGHQGLYHDTATGLVYNRARMLNPTLGRFMQRDPLGYVDGMSVYQYVGSNPLSRRDSMGRDWWEYVPVVVTVGHAFSDPKGNEVSEYNAAAHPSKNNAAKIHG
jgi:RHS repeat-associated protein